MDSGAVQAAESGHPGSQPQNIPGPQARHRVTETSCLTVRNLEAWDSDDVNGNDGGPQIRDPANI